MCHPGIVIWFVLLAVLVALLALVVRRLGLFAVGRLANALSIALLVGAVYVRAAGEDVDCRALCTLVDLGIYSWFWALSVGCWC